MRTTLCLLSRAVLVALLVTTCLVSARGQLVINQQQSLYNLVSNSLIGPGVAVGDTFWFNGSSANTVPPTVGPPGQIGRFNGSNTVLDISQGLFLCTGYAATVLPGPNNFLMQTTGFTGYQMFLTSPDLDLSHLTNWADWNLNGGNNIGNKAVLEFDFVPSGDLLSLRYVFSSEEYERWACSTYNDVIGFFLSGPGITGPYTNNAMNIALVPGSLDPVNINSINSGEQIANANGPWYSPDPWEYCRDNYPSWLNNVQYYRYNGGQWPIPMPPFTTDQIEEPYASDPYYIQHNGLTTVLTASAAVQCGETYRIKLAIGNVSDNFFASAVWLEQHSFTSANRFSLTVADGPNVVPGDTVYLNPSDTDSIHLRFNRWGGFYEDEWLHLSVGGDAVNGTDIIPALPDSIHFNQLDSSVVLTILAPQVEGPSKFLRIDLVTCGGDQVVEHPFMISMDHTLSVRPTSAVLHPMRIMPNPAKVLAELILPASLERPVDLFVMDATGRTVRQERITSSGHHQLEVDGLSNGVYTLKAVSRTGTGVTRLAVQR